MASYSKMPFGRNFLRVWFLGVSWILERTWGMRGGTCKCFNGWVWPGVMFGFFSWFDCKSDYVTLLLLINYARQVTPQWDKNMLQICPVCFCMPINAFQCVFDAFLIAHQMLIFFFPLYWGSGAFLMSSSAFDLPRSRTVQCRKNATCSTIFSGTRKPWNWPHWHYAIGNHIK